MLLRIHCFVVRTFKQLYAKVVWHLHLHAHGTTIVLEHLSSHSIFSGVRVTRFLVLCVCFADRYFFFLPIVFSVLRFTDFDYLPSVSSNSSLCNTLYQEIIFTTIIGNKSTVPLL